MLKLAEVTQYIHLDSTCSMSYYECLAKRFSEFDFSQVSYESINKSTCQFNNICLPFSLPFIGKNIPICKDIVTRMCYMKIMDDLEADQVKYCKKACRLEEFKILGNKLSLSQNGDGNHSVGRVKKTRGSPNSGFCAERRWIF